MTEPAARATSLSEARPRARRRPSIAGATVRLLGGVGVAQHRHGRGAGRSSAVVRRHRPGGRVAATTGRSAACSRPAATCRTSAFNACTATAACCSTTAQRPSDRRVRRRVRDVPPARPGRPADARTRTTLAPADLLLTKLQIVELNRKDLSTPSRCCSRTSRRPERRRATSSLDRLVEVTSHDWGWFTTFARQPRGSGARRRGDPAGRRRQSRPGAWSGSTGSPALAGGAEVACAGRRARGRPPDPWYELPEEVRHGVRR